MSVLRVEELSPWVESKLICGIGHHVSGRVRSIRCLYRGKEGDEYWGDPHNEYDPDKCVVCGLLINKPEASE